MVTKSYTGWKVKHLIHSCMLGQTNNRPKHYPPNHSMWGHENHISLQILMHAEIFSLSITLVNIWLRLTNLWNLLTDILDKIKNYSLSVNKSNNSFSPINKTNIWASVFHFATNKKTIQTLVNVFCSILNYPFPWTNNKQSTKYVIRPASS